MATAPKNAPESRVSAKTLSREPRGAEIQRRLAELQAGGGLETLASTIHIPAESKDRWALWAAESLVWIARRMRAGEWREALRGWGKLCEERGRNGGFLPAGLSDHCGTIQNALERRLA